MSLLDGGKKSSLPSLSWDSISDGDGTSSDAPASASSDPNTVAPAPGEPGLAAATSPLVSPTDDPTGPIRLNVSLDADSPAPTSTPEPAESAPSTPMFSTTSLSGVASTSPADAAVERTETAPAEHEDASWPRDMPVPAQPLSAADILGDISIPSLDTTPSHASPAPPATPQPANAPAVPPTETPAPVRPIPEPAPAPTPVHETPAPAPAPAAAPAPAPAAAPAPTTAPAPAAAMPATPTPDIAPAPAVDQTPTAAPAVPAPGPAVPSYQLPVAAPAPAARQSPLAYQQPETSRSRRRRSGGGSGVGLLLTLLVLGGLIAAAFVYGRPYLFPDDWDAATKPFADSIEDARGTAIVEPFTIIEEPTDTYTAGFDGQLVGQWETDLPLFRAFGLAAPNTSSSTVPNAVTQRPSAYFSLADRQVHVVAPLDAPAVQPAVAEAAVEAALDQEFRWTLALGATTPERDALIRALVRTQVDQVRTQMPYPGPVSDVAVSPQLPTTVQHQAIAPSVYAAVLGTPAPGDARLGGLESFGTELPGATTLPLASPATLTEGDTIAGDVRAMDRTFWFLVFGARLDAAVANDLSSGLTAASLTELRTPDGSACWSATFTLPTTEEAFVFASTLNAWAAAAPVEAATTIAGISETVIELRTCDPGPAAVPVTPSNTGVVSSLLGYRATELAVIAGVTERGGAGAEILAGLELLRLSSVGDELAATPFVDAATLASTARERVTPFVDAATASLPAAAPAASTVDPNAVDPNAAVVDPATPVVDPNAAGG